MEKKQRRGNKSAHHSSYQLLSTLLFSLLGSISSFPRTPLPAVVSVCIFWFSTILCVPGRVIFYSLWSTRADDHGSWPGMLFVSVIITISKNNAGKFHSHLMSPVTISLPCLYPSPVPRQNPAQTPQCYPSAEGSRRGQRP